MFQAIMNFFTWKEFYTNPDAAPLSAEEQFGISLGHILGKINRFYTNSLDATKDIKSHKKSMVKWWGISDKISAQETLAWCIQDGHRGLYNHLAELFIECDGNKDKLDKSDKNYATIAGYFDSVNELLATDEGKKWFPDFKNDFTVMCDAWDLGRAIFVSRFSYSAGYITEDLAWQYIKHARKLAQMYYDNWHDFAKSYLLGRAFWNGKNDFDMFSRNIDALMTHADSPWVKHGWLK